jgi:anti-sigma factor RsiW
LVEHLNQQQYVDYCLQQLSVAELLLVSAHLGECEACRRRVEGAMSGDAIFFALRSELFGEAAGVAAGAHPASAHLTAEQTAASVDGALFGEALQTVADHLATCGQCDLAVADLRAFRDEVAPSLESEYRPAPVPAKGRGRRMAASLSALFRVSPAPAFGAALAVLLLAVTGWFIWLTARERERSQEVVVAPAPSPPAPVAASPAPMSEPAPVSPPTEPVALVARLNDGGALLTLDRDGKLSGADGLPPVYRSLVKQALTTRQVERSSQLEGLTRPPSSLMGSGKQGREFSVTEPVGNVLMTAQPTFRWSPMGGATGYVVEVYDGKFNPVATSPQLTGHAWAALQPLARGQVYAWQVKAFKDGQEVTAPRPPAPQARFRILNQTKANELAKARRAYPSSHLTLGLLYAEAGLLKEAEQELRLLRRANPDSEPARRLLAQVRALRRRSG